MPAKQPRRPPTIPEAIVTGESVNEKNFDELRQTVIHYLSTKQKSGNFFERLESAAEWLRSQQVPEATMHSVMRSVAPQWKPTSAANRPKEEAPKKVPVLR